MRARGFSENGIAPRTLEYAAQVIRYYKTLQHSEVGRVIGRQLLKSGTSIGANVHEAQSAQSKADFLSKIQIAHKEARESDYWLKLLEREHLGETRLLAELTGEIQHILRILSSIILTTKQRTWPERSTRNI
jgi:four helix bundle protein